MKHTGRRTLKSCVSLLLALCMILSIVPMTALAAEDDTFNYVSVGASNTNGYGMRGYITEEELALLLSGQVSKDDVNDYGYERKPEGAYPDLIRDHYTEKYNDVKINQLAISSMRVEELRILLDDTYMGDDYSSWRFTGSDGWFLSAEPGGLEALRASYKDNIANADLITVDIGWNNFGVYVCNQLVDFMANGQYKWTTDLSNIFKTEAELQAANEAKAIIGNYIKNYVGEGAMTNALTDIFAYSILGYIHNFDIVMEKIYELNPDADVVVLGIQNLLYGVVVDLNGEQIPLGTIFGNFVNMANYYSSACSPYQSKYQYVKVGTDEHVTIFLDYMKSYNGDAEHLDQNVKDCFDYYDNDLFIQTRVDYMAAELIKQMIAAEFGEDMLDTALQLLKCESWLDVVAKGKAGNLPTLLGTNYQEVFDAKYWPALYAAYDTLAEVVKTVASYPSVDANGLLTGSFKISDVENALKKALEDEVTQNAIAAASGEAYTVDVDTIHPDAQSKIVAAMYIRYYMGNSFFAHPNGTGHAEIANAVLGVINAPETEKDQALSDYLIESVKKIHQLLCGAANHAQDWTITTAPTCEEAGVTVAVCACGTSKTVIEETAALGHDEVVDKGKPATCTEDGLSDGSHCSVCNKVLTAQEVIPSDGHSYESVVTAPTCTEAGFTTYTCSACGDSYTADEVAETGHSYETVVTDPTCTEAGFTTYTCSACGDSYVADEVAAAGHNMVDGVCTVCGHTEGTTEPEPPVEPEDECEYLVEETLTSGETYILSLGGAQVGTYTFTQVDGGWTIQAADGTYLAIENKALVNSQNAFTWTYANGAFSAVVETKSSNSWWGSFGNWWGSSSKQTYYLVASGSAAGVSTASAGSEAAFYTSHSAASHDFGAGVVTAPTCTEGGYTTYTCSRCGHTYTGANTEKLGHNYEAVVTAPTCTEDGYTTYTCSVCGDSYVDDYVDAIGHNYVDGICTNCGHDTNEPEIPVEPEGECVYLAEKALTSGETYVLSLGGTQVGTYTFTQVSGGWTIQTADGTYLALENKTLTNTADAFTWTYSGNQFSTTVKSSASNSWWGNWWGSRTQTYYLVASGSSIAASTSSSGAAAKFYQEVSGEHVYGDPVSENGVHVFTCVNCGNVKTVPCSDETCELCHPVVKINVSVAITSKSSGNSWWGSFGSWWGSGSKTTYTAKITVNAEGTEVASVAYSTNGGSTWTEGTSFDSTSEITAFDIRVVGTNGVTYYFAYSNGTVTQVG